MSIMNRLIRFNVDGKLLVMEIRLFSGFRYDFLSDNIIGWRLGLIGIEIMDKTEDTFLVFPQ